MPNAKPRKRRFVRRSEIEILIPLFYNDGRPIEEEKRQQTVDELLERYGGCRITANTHPAYEGIWEHSGAVYRDLVKSLVVEAPLRAVDYDWLSAYKRKLQRRFDQIEVYISVSDIKRIV